MSVELSDRGAESSLAAVCQMLDGGYLRICDVLGMTLAELRLGSPAFAAPAGREAVAGQIEKATATRSGTAATFALLTRDRVEVINGQCGEGGLVLDTNEIEAGGKVAVTRFAVTQEA